MQVEKKIQKQKHIYIYIYIYLYVPFSEEGGQWIARLEYYSKVQLNIFLIIKKIQNYENFRFDVACVVPRQTNIF